MTDATQSKEQLMDEMVKLAERAIEEWFTTHDGEEIDCRALARIAVMQGEVGGLREALHNLAIAAGALTVVTDGQENIRAERQTVVDAMEKAADALTASPPVDQGRVERLEALLVRTQDTIRDAANGEEPRFGELWRAIDAALAKDETAREQRLT